MSDRTLSQDEMARLFAALIRHETRNLIAGGAFVLAAQAGLIPVAGDDPGDEPPAEADAPAGTHAPVPLAPAHRDGEAGHPPAGYLPEKKKPGRPPKHLPAAGGAPLPPAPGYQPQLGPPSLGGPRPGGAPQ